MSEIKIDWEGHVKKYRTAMEELNLDFCVLTRVKSITYLSGCFVPWKSYIFLPKEGAGGPPLSGSKATSFCPHCGKDLDWRFCPYCGKPLPHD